MLHRYRLKSLLCAPALLATAAAFAATPNVMVREAASLGASVQAVEYFHQHLEQYFVTADAVEIGALDSGAFPGWWRTGQRYRVGAAAGAEGAVPVCRFYTAAFAGKPSHFYTASSPECEHVKQNLPEWVFEGVVFHVQNLDGNGRCAAGSAPLYRLYNAGRGGAPNHAYTPYTARRDRLIEAGWLSEGAAWCVPQALEDPVAQTSLLANSRWELPIPDPMSYSYGKVQTTFAAKVFQPTPSRWVFQYPFDLPDPAVAIGHSMSGPGVWNGQGYFEPLTGRFLILGTSAWNNIGDAWELESALGPTSSGCYFVVIENTDSRYSSRLHPFQPVLWSGCSPVVASRLSGTQ